MIIVSELKQNISVNTTSAPIQHSHSISDLTDLALAGIANYVQATQPVAGTSGDLWFNDTTNELKIFNGIAWEAQTQSDGYF